MKLNTKQLTVDDLKHLSKEGTRLALKTYDDNNCGRASAAEVRLAVFIGDLVDTLDTLIVEAELAQEKDTIPPWTTPLSQLASGPLRYLNEVRNTYPDAQIVDSSYGDTVLYTYWSNSAGVDAIARYQDGEFSWRDNYGPSVGVIQQPSFPDPTKVFAWLSTYYPNAWYSNISSSEFAPVMFWMDKEGEGRTAAIARYQRGIFNWLESYRPEGCEQSYNWCNKEEVDASPYNPYSDVEFIAADEESTAVESKPKYYINTDTKPAEQGSGAEQVAGTLIASIH